MAEVNAKEELTLQLVDMLTEHIYDGIKSIFDKTKEETSTQVLLKFQEKLCSIPLWNQDIIDKEYDRIIQHKDTEHLDKLLDMLFVSHVKVLSVLKINDNNKVNIQVPNSKTFIHKCYIETARSFYKDPFLIDDRLRNYDYSEIQRNIKRSHQIITHAIQRTVRDLIPLKEILEAYSKTLEEPEDVVEDIKEDLAEIGEETNEIEQEPETNEIEQEPETNEMEQKTYGITENEGVEENDYTDRAFMAKPDLTVTSGQEIHETPSILQSFPERELHHHQQPHHEHHEPQHEIKNILIPSNTSNASNGMNPSNGYNAFASNESNESNESKERNVNDTDPFFSDDEE